MTKVGAVNGGCWYCEDDEGEMVFCYEFDTFLHLDCLRKELSIAVKAGSLNEDLELRIIQREFEDRTLL